jgi:hypothetical protein
MLKTILALTLIVAQSGIAGCDGDDRSMNLIPVCYHNLTVRHAGPATVNYRISRSGNCDIIKVTYYVADGSSRVVNDPDIPWYAQIRITHTATQTIGFRAEVSATDGSITSTVVGTAAGGSVTINMSETCSD